MTDTLKRPSTAGPATGPGHTPGRPRRSRPGILGGLARGLRLRPTMGAFAGDERGIIIVMFALLLPVMVAFIGLGVEIGLWFSQKRDLQAGADAAAIAAAYEVAEGRSSGVTTIATREATNNGWSSSDGSITVNYQYPASGAYTADDDAVEVLLTRQVNPMFIGYFIGGAVTINARAVATTLNSEDTACVLSLNTSGAGVTVSGNAKAIFDGCQVASNSSGDALAIAGDGLETDCYTVVGTVSDTTDITTDTGCTPKTGSAAVDDPYDDLVAPDEACDSTGFTHNSNTSVTFAGNGSYTDAYVICGAFWVKKGTVTMSPGLYVIDTGDFKTNSTGSLVGDGVTIVLRNGARINNINGSSSVDLSAPDPDDTDSFSQSAGVWEGILFYQDRDTTTTCTGNNCNTLNGNSTSTFEGVVYFPKQEININGGNEVTSTCFQVVAYQIAFSGNGDMNADNSGCADAGVEGIPLPGNVGLVE